MCTIAVYGLITLHGGVHNLYATRSAPLGCTILNVVAAQAPRHSMMKLCSHRSNSTARQRYCALAKLYHCIIFSTCVRRVLQRRSWQSGMESPWQHYNPSRTLAVHRQLPTPRYAPLAPWPLGGSGYEASVTCCGGASKRDHQLQDAVIHSFGLSNISLKFLSLRAGVLLCLVRLRCRDRRGDSCQPWKRREPTGAVGPTYPASFAARQNYFRPDTHHIISTHDG
jgi:hypothetical protein